MEAAAERAWVRSPSRASQANMQRVGRRALPWDAALAARLPSLSVQPRWYWMGRLRSDRSESGTAAVSPCLTRSVYLANMPGRGGPGVWLSEGWLLISLLWEGVCGAKDLIQSTIFQHMGKGEIWVAHCMHFVAPQLGDVALLGH